MARPHPLLLGRAAVLFCLAEIALRSFSIVRTVELFGAHLGAGEGSEHTATSGGHVGVSLSRREVSTLVILERIGGRWPLGPPGGCLRHSLAVAHILRRHSPCIRLAVCTDIHSVLSAHAWVEVAGMAVTVPGVFSAALASPVQCRKQERLA